MVIGLLGPTLDEGKGPGRWERWRPSIAICSHDDLLVDRFELLFQPRYSSLAEQITEDLGSVSPETKVALHRLDFADPWDFGDVYGVLHAWTSSYPFDAEAEDYLIHITTGTHVAQICLFLLTESRHLPGRLVQASPPTARNQNLAGSFTIIDLDLSKYDRIAARFADEQRDRISFLKGGIDTRNAAFNRLIDRIEQVATASKDPILLTGPTGAGKSKLARRIYDLKRSRHQVSGAFVELNCATIRGDSAMSALFGHVKGSFTGAVRDRAGLLKAADGGMLFLDEVGELGLDEQAMLLRALEEKVFVPLGADVEARSDFQLIAGTNRDLAALVTAGGFRDDLLARINLWTFRMPGLRERSEDIEPNLHYELEQFARRSGSRVTFSREARARFLRFAESGDAQWSGNFRDLNASVTRMATLAPGGRISVDVVEEEIGRLKSSWHDDKFEEIDLLLNLIGSDRLDSLDRFDRVQLAEVVRVCKSSKSLSDAGRLLFAASRGNRKTTNDADRLRKYLARFELDWTSVR